MSDLLNYAVEFAHKHFYENNVMRKYTGAPYIVHPLRVMEIVSSVTEDDNILSAAILHDSLEDCESVSIKMLYEHFNNDIASMVLMLTDTTEGKNRAARKAADRERLAGCSSEVQTIKLADLIDNTKDIVKHDPKFAKTYLLEKWELLKVLDRGNQELYKKAYQLCVNGLHDLGVKINDKKSTD